MTTRTGPFEDVPWPPSLQATAVSPDVPPRLHGYDIEGDLARHYTLGETMLLALTGEAPSRSAGQAFEAALTFASACPINEAPTHGARLARSFGAPATSAVTAGILIGFEAVGALLDEHAALLDWLEQGSQGALPAQARTEELQEARSVEQLRLALAAAHSSVVVPDDASRTAAIVCVLWACGLDSRDRLLVALSWAKTLSIAAEVIATPRGGLMRFPALLPDFRYEAPR